MKSFRTYRFPPLSQLIAAGAPADENGGQWQASVAAGFEQGQRDGYEVGLTQGQEDGYDTGLGNGMAKGREDGRRETLMGFDKLARPVDAILKQMHLARADYRAAQRKEVVELVAKVARQVIRAELALQPVQLLALVDETLASMPPTREEIDVFLNPEELKRISELDPKRAKRWNLIADARLDAGECRIRAGDNEVDAGCHQRLAACMEQVSSHLQLAAEHADQDMPGHAPDAHEAHEAAATPVAAAPAARPATAVAPAPAPPIPAPAPATQAMPAAPVIAETPTPAPKPRRATKASRETAEAIEAREAQGQPS